jgi:Co/Zn/Cd efflux system component
MVHVHTHVHHLPWCTNKKGEECLPCEKQSYGLSAAIAFSVGTLLFLAAYAIGSVAGQGDATHLLMDGCASMVSYYIVYLVVRGPSREGELRKRGAYVQAFLLALAALLIFLEALFHEDEVRSLREMYMLGGASTFAAFVRFFIVHRQLHVSITAHGEMGHLLLDVGTSLAVLVTPMLIQLGGSVSLDRYIAGFVIAPLALIGSIRLARNARKGQAAH